MNRPCGGLSRSAFLANCRFTIAVAATRVAAAAKAAIAGYRLKATRRSDRNEEEDVCGKAISDALTKAVCTSHSRSGKRGSPVIRSKCRGAPGPESLEPPLELTAPPAQSRAMLRLETDDRSRFFDLRPAEDLLRPHFQGKALRSPGTNGWLAREELTVCASVVVPSKGGPHGRP